MTKVVSSFAEAVAAMDSAPWDFVIADFVLRGPWGNGIDVARSARLRGINVCVTTAFLRPTDSLSGLPAGAGFCHKDRLIACLPDLLSGCKSPRDLDCPVHELRLSMP